MPLFTSLGKVVGLLYLFNFHLNPSCLEHKFFCCPSHFFQLIFVICNMQCLLFVFFSPGTLLLSHLLGISEKCYKICMETNGPNESPRQGFPALMYQSGEEKGIFLSSPTIAPSRCLINLNNKNVFRTGFHLS